MGPRLLLQGGVSVTVTQNSNLEVSKL